MTALVSLFRWARMKRAVSAEAPRSVATTSLLGSLPARSLWYSSRLPILCIMSGGFRALRMDSPRYNKRIGSNVAEKRRE